MGATGDRGEVRIGPQKGGAGPIRRAYAAEKGCDARCQYERQHRGAEG